MEGAGAREERDVCGEGSDLFGVGCMGVLANRLVSATASVSSTASEASYSGHPATG